MTSSAEKTASEKNISIDGFENMHSIDDVLALTRIAEAAERYPDMCKFIKTLVEAKCKNNQELEIEERNLLSVAYKNVVGSKRSSWRTLYGGNFDDSEVQLVKLYRGQVEGELKKICEEVLDLLQKSLYPQVKGKGDETEVFYLKMIGDYNRYLSEFLPDQKYLEATETNYKSAMDAAKSNLPETHPTRLGLALNFSVCYYEILKKPDKACELAKEAFDNAIEKLDTLNDASYKDSTLIMQLLRDNLTLWTSETNEDGNAENP